MTGKEFAEKHAITMSHVGAPENPHMADKGADMFNWYCTLTIGNIRPAKLVKCYYSKGRAHQGFKREGQWIMATQAELQEVKRNGYASRRLNGLLQPIPPAVGEVLECLASDCSGVDGLSFEDWAEELGYDTDSRKEERTYRVCREQAAELQRAMGREMYREFVDTVRDE